MCTFNQGTNHLFLVWFSFFADSARMVKRLKHMLDKADSGDGAAPVAVVSAPKVGR